MQKINESLESLGSLGEKMHYEQKELGFSLDIPYEWEKQSQHRYISFRMKEMPVILLTTRGIKIPMRIFKRNVKSTCKDSK